MKLREYFKWLDISFNKKEEINKTFSLLIDRLFRNKRIYMYTDGSYDSNRRIGGYSAMIVNKNRYYGIFNEEKYTHTTSERMEIMAVIEGLRLIKEEGKRYDVHLYIDSENVIRGINDIYIRCSYNWRKPNGSLYSHIDLWERLLPLLKNHHIITEHIKSHSEETYCSKHKIFNNVVDKMAKVGRNNNKKTKIDRSITLKNIARHD